jgi:hypothetical protein
MTDPVIALKPQFSFKGLGLQQLISSPMEWDPVKRAILPSRSTTPSRQAVVTADAISSIVAGQRNAGVVGERQRRTAWLAPQLDLESELGSRLIDLKAHTASVAMHLTPEWRAGLFRQLDSLMAEENWEPADSLPNPASYATAMRLLIFLKRVERPGLGLTHDGDVILAWTAGCDRLTIECGADDAVRWVLSHTLADGSRERAAGFSTSRRLPAVLAAYDPEKWLKPR